MEQKTTENYSIKAHTVSKIIFGEQDWHRGHVSKKNCCVIGYGNDYPMQHGDGESYIVPNKVIDFILNADQQTKELKERFEKCSKANEMLNWTIEQQSAREEKLQEEIKRLKGTLPSDLLEENERLEKELEDMTKQKDDLYNELYELKSQSSKEGITLPTHEENKDKANKRYPDWYTDYEEGVKRDAYLRGLNDLSDLIQKQITK